ncbi:MAG: hypothetical protein HY529_02695 [Chloroflexi bacterium]|nr:hypothetical protein [Chloroflexota bacterium]
MPGKSHSKKKKYSRPIKRFEGQESQAGIVAQAAAGQVHEPVSSIIKPVTPAKVTASALKSTAAQYGYVVAELRTIAILAALMVVVLFVLSLILT